MTEAMRVRAEKSVLARGDLSCASAENAVERAASETRGAARLLALTDAWRDLDLFQRLAVIRSQVSGRIVFTTSFGLEDQAIGYAIFSQRLAIETVTLDTGRLFPETYEVWAETEQRYGVRIAAYAPRHAEIEELVAKHGINGIRASATVRRDCCAVRKVVPLARALAGSAAWVTGIRADQSAERAGFAAISFDAQRNLIKANPLFDWTRDQTFAFVRAHDVPFNRLHQRGFLSIGCAPCTRAVAPGEPERAGRWWWEQSAQKECGLHTPSSPAAGLAMT